MIADTNAPKLSSCPLTWTPRPTFLPPPAALTSGVMTLSVNALISVLNASAITRPTATTMMSPCIRKFLNPFMLPAPPRKNSERAKPMGGATGRASRATRLACRHRVSPRRSAPRGAPARGERDAGRLFAVGGRDRDDAPAATGAELHGPRGPGEDRVVLADPDSVAGLEARAALAHDDLAAAHGLAGEHLHAEALGVRVAAVAARAEAFLMRHLPPPSSPPGAGSATARAARRRAR